jgi:signal transduction histidine kinase
VDRRHTHTLPNARTTRAIWLALLAGSAMAIGVISVWWMINDRARDHIVSATNDATRINQSLIQQDIRNRLSAIERLAKRWTAAGGTPRPVWEADVARYVRDMPGFQAIEWADSTLHIRWVVPLAGNDAAVGLDITRIEQARIAVATARESGKSTLTQPFQLAQGGLGIVAYSPVTRDKYFDGLMAGVVRLDHWLTSVITRVQSSNYNVRIFLEGQEVYRQDTDDVVDDTWTVRSDFEIHGLTWMTLITPTREFVSAVHAGSSTLILIVGLLLSILVAIVAYLAVAARLRSRQLHHAETEARQHREQLAHMDRLNMLGEMATGIAHEINQPLTAISLFAQAGTRLFSGKKNLERLPEIFEKLNQHAHRASAVIERMQGMARRQESVKEIFDCNLLVEEIAKLAESEARIRDMTIAVDTEKRLPLVAVDVVQIQQVALNLLRNGMEAMQSVGCRGGKTIWLTTKLRSNGDIEVAVVDRGCGVSKEVEKSLFTPFSTTKESGMGMGLSISRAIIAAHGGHLDFRNNDAGGATFFFGLPPANQGDVDG